MTNAFYFYRKDLGDGLKYLGTLERVGEADYRFTYCENPVLLVGKPKLPHRDTPCTTKEVKYSIMDALAPPYGEPEFETIYHGSDVSVENPRIIVSKCCSRRGHVGNQRAPAARHGSALAAGYLRSGGWSPWELRRSHAQRGIGRETRDLDRSAQLHDQRTGRA